MKKLLVLAIALSLLSSCVKEAPRWERTYQIKNNSGYEVTIRAFEDFNGEGSFEDILLLDGEIYTGNKRTGSNYDVLNDLNSIRPATSFSKYSLIIVYDNQKRKEHILFSDDNTPVSFSEPIDGHVLRSGNYTNIGNDFFEFVLTEEDYNNAEPCDGDCLD